MLLLGRHGAVIRAATCLSNPVVMNNSDSGAGSLRQAILDACDGGMITFANTVTSPITLATELAIDKNLTVAGPGANALTISGNNAARVFNIGSVNMGINVTISGLRIANGQVTSVGVAEGGGILNNTTGTLTIINSTISGNTASGGGGSGGGIFTGFGSLMIDSSTISGNTAASGGGSGNGGGIHGAGGPITVVNSTISGNTASGSIGNGGGIAVFLQGRTSIINSTISGNTASGGEGTGGGLVLGGLISITNSTISGNTALGSASSSSAGGGIQILAPETTTITNSTISGNAAVTNGGTSIAGGIAGSILGNVVNVRNTIIALNTASSSPDVWNDFISQGHNLIGKNDGSTGFTNGSNNDQVGSVASPLDPTLGPLQNNGGSTPTMALLAGSPAIDAGDDSVFPVLLTTDQRGAGFPRKSGLHVDIGAFELQQFDACLKDNSTGDLFQWNSTTGQYMFTRCSGGFVLTGTGVVGQVNGILTLTDSKPDRRISAGLNLGSRIGGANIYLQLAPGVSQLFRINDTNPSAVCKC